MPAHLSPWSAWVARALFPAVLLVATGCSDRSSDDRSPLVEQYVAAAHADKPFVLIAADHDVVEGNEVFQARVSAQRITAETYRWSASGPFTLVSSDGPAVQVKANPVAASTGGKLQVEVKGTDGTGASRTITVAHRFYVRGATHATDDQYALLRDETLEVQAPGVLGNDLAAVSELTRARVVTPPEHGTVWLGETGDFAYRPDAGYKGPDQFTYELDEGGAKARATARITVRPPALQAVDDFYAGSEFRRGGVYDIEIPEFGMPATDWSTLLANDDNPLGEPLTVTSVSNPCVVPMGQVINRLGVFAGWFPNCFSPYPLVSTYTARTTTGTEITGTVKFALLEGNSGPYSRSFTVVGQENGTYIPVRLLPSIANYVYVTSLPAKGTLYWVNDDGSAGPQLNSPGGHHIQVSGRPTLYYRPVVFESSWPSPTPPHDLLPYTSFTFQVVYRPFITKDLETYLLNSPTYTVSIVIVPLYEPP